MADVKHLSEHLDRLAGARVIYTDLDGTMLGRNGSFVHTPSGDSTTEPVEALLAALRAGIDLVPASGRALQGLVTDARILGLSTVIAEMGALIAYENGRTVVQNFGPTPEGGMPVEQMERTGAIAMLLERYEGSIEYHAPWHTWRQCTQLFRGLLDVDEANELLWSQGHDWLELHDNGRLRGAYLRLEPGRARVYHLQPRGVTKGHAVGLDRARRGFAADGCIAIGDAVADLELAAYVGTMVLVGDALEDDPALVARIEAMENVLVTERPQNLGWADTVREAAARA